VTRPANFKWPVKWQGPRLMSRESAYKTARMLEDGLHTLNKRALLDRVLRLSDRGFDSMLNSLARQGWPLPWLQILVTIRRTTP